MMFRTKTQMVDAADALKGRSDQTMPVPERHAVLGTPLTPPWPEGMQTAAFGLGCFWGGEELYWEIAGVYTTAVGYAGGFTPNPTYEETCSGRTGHAEAALVVFDPAKVSYDDLLRVFWENHDPTLGMRQGNDVGTQYRSVILTTSDKQRAEAEASLAKFQATLDEKGYGQITTEIAPLGDFYYAEPYHQQYLHKNPHGYRCHSKTGLQYS